MATRRILVTGANKGIGKATVAAILAAADDTMVLLGSRDLGRGEAAVADILSAQPAFKGRLEVLQLDVSDDASVAEAALSTTARFGASPPPLYGVVNNAGMGFGDASYADTLEVNTRGLHRVTSAFLPLLDPAGGRVVNVTSAAGPNFVSKCSPERQAVLTDPAVTLETIEAVLSEALAISELGDADAKAKFAAVGLGDGGKYGLSKACANAYTLHLARTQPMLRVNACTPGWIDTDLTAHYKTDGKSAADLGMKSPSEGTRATLFCLLGDPQGTGRYYGSDAVRSPMDRYRSPGAPPYEGP